MTLESTIAAFAFTQRILQPVWPKTRSQATCEYQNLQCAPIPSKIQWYLYTHEPALHFDDGNLPRLNRGSAVIALRSKALRYGLSI
jgi:hypothetical protein